MKQIFMGISIMILLIVCMMQIKKGRKIEKKMQEMTDAVSQFIISAKLRQEETLEEGALANLWNEITRMEQMFCYQRHRNEIEKEQLNRFMENMAHQMKTTLAALQIRIDSAQMAAITEQEKYTLERSQECMERMTGEIERILNSSQLAAGKVEMHLQEVNLGIVIQNCVHNLKPLAGKRHVNIREAIPEQLKLKMDEFWIEQALENLLKNAIEHTRETGEVSIEARKNGNQIEIHIEDEGEGIEAAELPYIFERFHRGSATKAGYGIGLSMAADIVKAHHGEIRAGNRSVGGAWFLIRLPILEGAQAYNIARINESAL